MISLQFVDHGSEGSATRRRLLSLDDRSLKAKSRNLLRVSRTINSAFVVSGRLARQHLRDAKTYDEFCRLVDQYRRKTQSNLGAFKLLVKDLRDDPQSRQFHSHFDVVAWDLGPVPVCQLGKCGNTPVYALPELQPTQQKWLFPILIRDDANILGAIADTLNDCIHEYFSDIADLLRSSFARSKTEALKVALEVERILSTSVEGKLRLIDDHSKSPDIEQIRERIRLRYEQNLPLYRAEAAVLSAATACLRWSVGDDIDMSGAISIARQKLDPIDDEVLEKKDLVAALELLASPPRPDKLSDLFGDTDAHRFKDLKLACRFLSEVTHLLQKKGRSSLFVFVSHHMNVYASEEFYSHFSEYARGPWKNIVVWTGYGRQQHILFTILAKIWLSDVQILYLPNSLATRTGGEKELKTAEDWVLEEICYGAQIRSNFHCVVAQGSDPVSSRFLKQMEKFHWTTLHSPFLTEESIDLYKNLYNKFKDHLHDRIFTPHHPNRNGLTDADAQLIKENVLQDLVKKRLEHLVGAMRLGTKPDHWRVVEAMINAQAADNMARDHPEFDRPLCSRDILLAIGGRRRSDGRAFSRKWVVNTLREVLCKKVITVHPDVRIKLIERGPRVKRFKTYMFGLGRLARALPVIYNIDVDLSELDKVLLQAIMNSS